MPTIVELKRDAKSGGAVTPFVTAYQQRAQQIARARGCAVAAVLGEAIQLTAKEAPELYAQHDRIQVALSSGETRHLSAPELFAVQLYDLTQRQAEQRAAIAEQREREADKSQFEKFAETVLRDEFGGDPARYAEAMDAAAAERPDLARAYVRGEHFAEVSSSTHGINPATRTAASFSSGAKQLARQVIAFLRSASDADTDLLSGKLFCTAATCAATRWPRCSTAQCWSRRALSSRRTWARPPAPGRSDGPQRDGYSSAACAGKAV